MAYDKKAVARILRLLADLVEDGTYYFVGYEESTIEPERIAVGWEPYDVMYSFIVQRPVTIFTEKKNEDHRRSV